MMGRTHGGGPAAASIPAQLDPDGCGACWVARVCGVDAEVLSPTMAQDAQAAWAVRHGFTLPQADWHHDRQASGAALTRAWRELAQPCRHRQATDPHDGCSCPLAHPLLALLLGPVWGLLPGRVQGWVCGDPCWAREPDR